MSERDFLNDNEVIVYTESEKENLNNFNVISLLLKKYLFLFSKKISESRSKNIKIIRKKEVNDIFEFKDYFEKNVCPFLLSIENKKYLNYKIRNKNIVDKLKDIFDKQLPKIDHLSILMESEIVDIRNAIYDFADFYSLVTIQVDKEDESNSLIDELTEKVQQANKSLENLHAAKLALEGQKTEEIYSVASKSFLKFARFYDILFYIIVILTISLAFFILKTFPYNKTNIVDFILSKVILVTIFLTLGTLFLRKAAHLRKRYDQTHQTSLELQALPLFIKGLSKDDQSTIIKELSGKYFGKELDQSQNEKIGDLLNEQLKVGTELIRASSDMIKGTKENNLSNNEN